MKLPHSPFPSAFAAAVAVTLALATGCQQEKAAGPQSNEPIRPGKTAAAAADARAPALTRGFAGTVIETMDSGGYTYVQVDTGKETIWAAAPLSKVKVGDKVTVPEGMPMKDFHSKTLNRDFKLIYFVGGIGGDAPAEGETASTAGTPAALPPGHPPVAGAAGAAETAEPAVTGIAKAAGGKTVAEIYAGTTELAGKTVIVRGKVVKTNSGILGKNWLHLRDGTGDAGTNDLTVTTEATAQKGDVVVVTGTVTTDKDFGAGYKYPVLIEDAQVTVEAP